jgi:hypothetical protein
MDQNAAPAATVTVEPHEEPVHVFLRDTDGRVVGGLTGHPASRRAP